MSQYKKVILKPRLTIEPEPIVKKTRFHRKKKTSLSARQRSLLESDKAEQKRLDQFFRNMG